MDSEQSKPKTFEQKLWDFVEGPLCQTGVGLVLIAIGAFLSSKSAMVLALLVFLLAAYRAKLFDHGERYKRVLSYIGVPFGIVLVLIAVWIGALKIKGGTQEASIPGNAATTVTLRPAPQEVTGPAQKVEGRGIKRTETKEKQSATPATHRVPVDCGDGRTAPSLTDCGVNNLEMSGNRFVGPGAAPDLSNAHHVLMGGNIFDNQAHGPQAGMPEHAAIPTSGITFIDNSVREGRGKPDAPSQPSALFDIKQLDNGCFDNNTVVGSTEILKADKATSVTGTNNVGYSDPKARPAIAGSDRRYNYYDWLSFLDDFDGIVAEDKSPAEHIAKLRTRMESEWVLLAQDEREKRRQELASMVDKLKTATAQTYWSVTEPLRHPSNVPPFVRMPCQ